jgi:pre-mRNA-processing factor 39
MFHFQAIPLSVDLWIHYLNHVKQAEESKDNTDFIRQQYEKAVEVQLIRL